MPTSSPKSAIEAQAEASADLIAQAVSILKAGGLVAMPTETVYGLGADAQNMEALRKLYTVKGRPCSHPVIVHLASLEQLPEWASEIPESAWKLARAFWPGPLTLILPRTSRVPNMVTGGQDTVGLRIPGHPLALELLNAFGGGIAAPSANHFGRISPTTAAHVEADLGNDVDLVLDGGACPVGVESTIVSFNGERPLILRPGMITQAQIAEVLGQDAETRAEQMEKAVIRAPGTLASHYAPVTPLMLVPPAELVVAAEKLLAEQEGAIGVLARTAALPASLDKQRLTWVEGEHSPEGYARGLYAVLRELDGRNLKHILVEELPDTEVWWAVWDRLKRAACRE